MTIELWGNGQTRAFSVHWILHELALPYEKNLIGARTGETQTLAFLALNSQGKVPVLRDGDLIMTESAAIITYLSETYGSEKGLMPELGSALRAQYFQWCFFAMTELDAQSLYIVRKHIDLAHIYGEAPVAVKIAQQTFLKQIKAVEHALDDGRHWILGTQFTGADILLVTALLWGKRSKLILSAKLDAYASRAAIRPAYRAACSASGRQP